MLKYIDTLVGFSEIPDEITLCINISNCPNNCEGCHSPWLSKDEGIPLTYVGLKSLIDKNKGITCICFMGGDKEPWEIQRIAKLIQLDYDIKVGWYSGKDKMWEGINLIYFDYIKIGSYKKDLGPLTSPTTNQILYKVYHTEEATIIVDITNLFWKKHENQSKREV